MSTFNINFHNKFVKPIVQSWFKTMASTTSACLTILICISGYYLTLAANCVSIEYSNKIRNILSTQNDYDIIEGKLMFLFNSTAFFANPSSIYGIYTFQGNPNVSLGGNGPDTYFLRSQNGVIFPGCTAPSSSYISIVSYLYKRFNYIENGTMHKSEIIFGSLGDSLNDLVWNTSTTSTQPYDSLTTVIQTADKQTYNDMYNLLINNDISSSQINLQSLPNQYIHFVPYEYNANNINQYNQTYDIGNILYRIAIPFDKDEYQKYIHTNQTVFMMQPKNAKGNTPRIAFDPQTRNTYSVDNINETDTYNDSLNEYKKDLISYLETTYNMRYRKQEIFENSFTGDKANYGFSCIDNNLDCGGDNRDAQYWVSGGGSKLKNNSFYIIMGILHSNIKQTVYSNIVIYEHINKPGPTLSNYDYNGSALILPVNTNVNKNDLENMFVVQFARPYSCIKGLPGWCPNEQELGYNVDNVVSARNYLNSFTFTRPDRNEIIPNVLLEFEIVKLTE